MLKQKDKKFHKGENNLPIKLNPKFWKMIFVHAA